MAKSSRSSSKKANHRNIHAKAFSEAEKARLERLATKQAEIARSDRPERTEMDVEDTDATKEEELKATEAAAAADTAMDVDGTADKSTSRTKKAPGRIQKRELRVRRQKPRNTIVFPKMDARRQARNAKLKSKK